MPNTSSRKKWLVGGMRWFARAISVLWGYAAVLLTLFLAANYQIEGFFGSTACGLVVAMGILMLMGAAIVASVWRLEAIGGGLLLFDGVALMAALTIGLPHLQMRFVEFFMPSSPNFGLATPVVWTPILAGGLFLACHWISRARGNGPTQREPSTTGETIAGPSPEAGLQTHPNT